MLIGPSASIFSHCLTSHHPCQNIQRCESDEQCSDDVTDADDAPSDKRERVGRDFSFLFPSATGIIYPQKKKGGSVYPLGQSFSRRVLLLCVCQSASLQGSRIVGAEIERAVERKCRAEQQRHDTE